LPTQDTLAAAQTRGLEFGTALGCRDQTAACLRSKSVQEIIAKASTFVSGIPVQALDGTVLTRNMGEAFATGQFNKVPVIMGTNLDERTWFIGQTELASHVPLSTAAYPAQLGGGRNAALIQAEYPLSRYRNPSEALSAATTDSRFACGTRRGLRLLTQQVPTWAYEFRDRTAPFYFSPVSFEYGAAHTLEIQYLFPLFKGITGTPKPLNPAQQRLSDQMVRYWTIFARTGDPNSGEKPYWPTYKADRDNYQAMQLPAAEEVLDFSEVHKCAFWDSLQ
jgi:para-nitrobenzyl esterase